MLIVMDVETRRCRVSGVQGTSALKTPHREDAPAGRLYVGVGRSIRNIVTLY
jgi:hypothetical protein